MAGAHSRGPVVDEPMVLPSRRRQVRGAALESPRAGRCCFNRAWHLSPNYDAAFATISAVITRPGLGRAQCVPTFWSGFLLIGPPLAMGL